MGIISRLDETRSLFAFGAVLSGFATAGCTTLEVTKIKPGEENGGLTYCLLVPKAQIVTKEAVVYDKVDAKVPPFSKAARSIKTATVNLVQVPSDDHYYSVKVHSGPFSADTYGVTYDNNGCLSSYTFAAADQTGQAVSSLAGTVLAVAALAAAEKPQVTYPEPDQTTYLLDKTSRIELEKAEKRIKELADQGANISDKDRDLLNALLDRAAKLRDVLYPVPTHVISNEFQDLIWVPNTVADSETTDDWVIGEVLDAEKTQNGNGFLPVGANSAPKDDAYVVVIRALKPDEALVPKPVKQDHVGAPK
jgi:hypothetical protein